YSNDIKKLSDGILHDPVLIEVARRNATVDKISQVVHPVSKAGKRALLSQLITDGDWSQVLVFTRTKHGANRLAKQLITDGITASAIHGNKSQGARTRALEEFKNGKIRVLVATEVASRGLDINRLPHVVNFELPNVPEDYVHRIGRTGRAGEKGAAHSLVSADEHDLLKDIERLLKKSIPVEQIEGFQVNEADAKDKILKFGGGGGNNNRRGGGGGNNFRSSRGGGGNRSYGSSRGGGGGGGRGNSFRGRSSQRGSSR
ncbi:MAG: hypothetical protein JKY51_07510, partial [Opitutaceae bacterium]|nr:hypothetical protein [Opitutaceae bacterium]